MSQARLLTPASELSAKDWRSVASMIDHTLLKPEATRSQILELCNEEAKYHFATVCVQPSWAALAVHALQGTDIKVDVPIGFPQGAVLTSVKRFEAAEVLKVGASELDMVLNIGALKSGAREYVETDIRAVAERTREAGALLKVILEATLLSDEEK